MFAAILIAAMLVQRPGAPAQAARHAAPVSYEIPYRLSNTGHIVVRAKLNGKGPYSFILDTGAPTLIVATDVAQACGAAHAPGINVPFGQVEIEGGPTLTNEPGLVIDPFQLKTMNAVGLSGAKIAGVLGYTLVARFRMEIDLTRPHMLWTPIAYRPQPVLSLRALTGGKPLTAAPNQARLEGMADVATALLGSPPQKQPAWRGFLGIELDATAVVPTVRRVLAGGAAERAGFRPGDRITYLQQDDHDPVATPTVAELLRAAGGIAAGRRVSFTVERGSRNLLLVARTQRGGL